MKAGVKRRIMVLFAEVTYYVWSGTLNCAVSFTETADHVCFLTVS